MYAGVLLLMLGTTAASNDTLTPPPPFPFFAFCIDTHDSKKRTLEEQAVMLKELGYDGVGHLWLENIPERIATLDAQGLRLFQITTHVNLAPGKPPYDPAIREVFPLLKGRQVQICLIITGMPPSDVSGDERAVEIVRELSDLAQDSGTTLVLYPHVNDWLETVEDAIRLARKTDRPNVGVMFNLCHWLKQDDEDGLAALLQSALPWLVAVSINGADRAAEIRAGTGNWLQPLDSGTYDVLPLLQILKGLGYRGPVGLQCWGIEGDARGHLSRSMNAWKQLIARL